MRFFLFFLIFFFVPGSAYSQTSFGIKSGLNLSKAVYLDESDEALVKPFRKLKPGVHAGLFINREVNEVILIQAEILYSQKGLKFEQLPHNKVVNSMNYVEFPITGQYKLYKGVYSEMIISLGGYVAYWTDGKYKYTNLLTGQPQIEKVDFQNLDYQYNRFDPGIIGGITLKFKKLNFFSRYTHSMSGSSEFNADALTNRVFTFGIEYLIL